MRIFAGAWEIPNACMSVLTAMNSTPSKPAAIIELTALQPPPPRTPPPGGEAQPALRHIRHALHQRCPAGDHHTARNDALVTRPLDLPRDEIEDFLRARLDHVRQHPARERA